MHRVYSSNHVLDSPLLMFSTIVVLFTIADAIIAYSVPIYIESTYHSTTIMGFLMAISSTAGIVFDFWAGKKFSKTSYKIFLSITIALSAMVAATMHFVAPSLALIVAVLIIWGVYFETAAFANFNFIHKFMNIKQHNHAWGVVFSAKSLAYLAGPLITVALVTSGTGSPMLTALGLIIASFLVFVLFKKKFDKHKKINTYVPEEQKSFAQELKVWRVLGKHVWPLWIFNFFLILVDSSFWTVGIIFAERLRVIEPVGGLFLTAYMIPQVVVGVFLVRVLPPEGKKKTAFTAAIVAGVLLHLMAYMTSVTIILFTVLGASIFYAIAIAELLAVYEDYVARLGIHGNDLIGLQRTSESLAYILGPIALGYTVSVIGFSDTFSAVGTLLGIVAVVAMVVVPKKLRMPQKELLELNK